jgi:hypothetical protein
MKDRHLEFQELSDLYDGELPSGEYKRALENHLLQCQLCTDEYQKLKACLGLVRDYGDSFTLDSSFSQKTLKGYKRFKWRKNFLRTGSAVAAAMIVAGGFALFNPFNTSYDETIAQKGEETKTEQVISLIRSSKGRIVSVDGRYIEGEIDEKSFKEMQNKLGFENVTYRKVSGNSQPVAVQNNLSPVSVNGGKSDGINYVMSASPTGEQKIRFKVKVK